MKSLEFITEQQSISQHTDNGSLEGYVVFTDKPNISNYLSGQGVPYKLINQIIKKYKVVGLIRNIYVDDDSRGQGIGNDLVSNAIDNAADAGAEAIILVSDVSEENKFDLTKWYESFGFEVVGSAGGDPIMLLDLG
jgi:ribosomal protein S18 acetylase RimI-like enzyme